jgi:hypothetical protein
MRFHADCRAANASTTSPAATGDGFQWVLVGVGDCGLDNGGGVDTDRAGLDVPSCAQISDAEAGLAVAGVDSGFSFHRRVLERRRLSALPGVEVGELVAHLDTNLVRSLRELLEDAVGKPGDFGLAVHDRIEHHSEPCGDLSSKH